MVDQPTTRDPWRVIWQIATSDGTLVVLLLGLAICMMLRAWLPQISSTAPGAYARWLSMAQARFGEATSAMRTLGLFTIGRSFGFRALLAFLAGSLVLRVVETIDRLQRGTEWSEPTGEWQELTERPLPDVLGELRRRRYRVLSKYSLFQIDRWPWAYLFSLSAYAGVLLLLIGLLITRLWGWQVEGLLLQGVERTTPPGTRKWVALSDDARRVLHSPGIVTFVEERGPGVEISVVDDTGQFLELQQAAGAEPSTQLTVALTEDQYFAIPEKQMIVRVLKPRFDDGSSPQLMSRTQQPVHIEFYRTPSGQLITEMATEKEGSARLTLDDVTLDLTSAPYVRLTATFNPGRWPTGVGLLLLTVGLLGTMVWPARRFWLRERGEAIEGAGDLAPALTCGEEV